MAKGHARECQTNFLLCVMCVYRCVCRSLLALALFHLFFLPSPHLMSCSDVIGSMGEMKLAFKYIIIIELFYFN